MQLIQRKFATKINFIFTEDVLKYTIKDSNGSTSYNYKYENIDLKNESEMSVRNSLFRNAGIFCGIIAIVQIIFKPDQLDYLVPFFWVLSGILLTAFYYINIIKYKVYPTDNGNVLIIEDKKQITITNEIKKRRNQKLKEKYFEIDFRNSIENEIAKYKWLEEENVITKDEYKRKVTELKVKFMNSSFSVN